jgi:PTH1 family peptidyl-tRNA hydrolase
MENQYLIAGLGNPGPEYRDTRHNVGFLVAEALAEKWRAVWSNEKRFDARLTRVDRDGRRVLLLQPLTFMNCSGDPVAAVAKFFRVPAGHLMMVVDDADLPLGELRMRPSGGAGGHHGLESIQTQLGTDQYPRLRVGIGRAGGLREISGHVLGKFGPDERQLLPTVLDRAVSQLECWLSDGLPKAMNRYNGPVNRSEQKEKQ